VHDDPIHEVGSREVEALLRDLRVRKTEVIVGLVAQ